MRLKFNSAMKNWKTTLTGIILAILLAVQPLADGVIDFKKDWFKFLIAIGIAIFGFFAKDTNTQDK
jgi:hypothetical protein